MRKDGGAAFPTPKYYDEKFLGYVDGMTLRDWFAGQALVGLMASDDAEACDKDAAYAYRLADAMLAERAKP